MEHQRHVKVWDLLRTIWWKDAIELFEKMPEDTPNILKPGVTGTIILKTLNSASIEVIIDNLSCKVDDISDISWKPFVRDVLVENYEAIFCIPSIFGKKESILETYDSYNDIYEIDEKNLTIDLSTFISNAIKSQEPLVKKADDEFLLDWWENDDNFFEE